MYRHKYAVLGAVAALAVTVACSNAASPMSPNAAVPGSGAAGPNGETLKIAAPGTTAPVGGATAGFPLALTIANVNGTYASFPVTYRYEITNASGTTVATGTQAASSGAATSIVVNASLAFDSPHTWRVRAEYNGAFGPWSTPASFRSAAGSFKNQDTILDLLTDGKTLGENHGAVLTSDGAFFPGGDTYIAYALPQTIKNGEFSFLAQGVDEGNPCDKCKVMTMGEGPGDVTANDYRVSLEVRGNMYPNPGMVAYRMVNGDADETKDFIRDTRRQDHWPEWSRAQTYFFRLFWGTGFGGYEIREGGPTGPVHDTARVVTNGHEYRPTDHHAFIGSPMARGGVANSTHLGMTVKSVWISPNDRPDGLLTIFGRPQ